MSGDNSRLARIETTLEHHSEKLDKILEVQEQQGARITVVELDVDRKKTRNMVTKERDEKRSAARAYQVSYVSIGIAAGVLITRLVELVLRWFI